MAPFRLALSASLILAGLGTGSLASANAAQYDFNYVDTATGGLAIIASGSIATGGSAAGGFFDVIGISGVRNGFAITGLVAAGGYGSNDNLLSPVPNFLTFSGVTYVAADGNDYNFSSDGGAGYADNDSQTDPGGFLQTPINLTLAVIPESAAAIPEPASIALIAVSLLGLGVARSRRRR